MKICRSRRPSPPQALVYEHSGQHLEIELFDEDPDKDDFLGRCVSLRLQRSSGAPERLAGAALLLIRRLRVRTA